MGTSLLSILMLYLLEDLQYHIISSLDLTISLWVVWCGLLVFDVICLRQVLHVLIYKRGTIVVDQPLGDPKLCDNVLMNEV